MTDYTPYQKKLISRYYDHRDGIQLTKLQEIVTDLVLADTEARTKRLWSRANKAMEVLRVPPRLRDHIVTKADPEILARNIRDWLKAAKINPRRTSGR